MALPNVFKYPIIPYDEMIDVFRTLDLLLFPLVKSPFNDAKSCVKFVECGAVGVPVLASSADEYVSVIRHGENGWLADTQEEWAAILESILDHPHLLREAGESAFATVKASYSTLSQTGLDHVLRLLDC